MNNTLDSQTVQHGGYFGQQSLCGFFVGRSTEIAHGVSRGPTIVTVMQALGLCLTYPFQR